MKNKFFYLTGLALFLVQQTSFGQGSLTPPGAPAPTMKTLAQIEARTPISSPMTITNSGSYYLTTNLAVSSGNGIVIDANNVTLDLNGFTISSTAPSPAGTGILMAGTRNVTNISILNGFISSGVTNNGSGIYGGSGFYYGIYSSSLSYNAQISHVSVTGCFSYGIFGDYNTTVESCTVSTVGQIGIYGTTISHCTATDCGNSGIFAIGTANDCTGSGRIYGVQAAIANNCNGTSTSTTGSGAGVSATTVNNCVGTASGPGAGVNATVANNCYGASTSSGYGIFAGSIATGCTGYSSTGTGLQAFIANVCHATTGSGTPFNVTHNVNSY
jgi:hypothetical protein